MALKLAAVKFGRQPVRLTGSDEYQTAVLQVEKRLLEREQGKGERWSVRGGQTRRMEWPTDLREKFAIFAFFACSWKEKVPDSPRFKQTDDATGPDRCSP